MQRWLFQIARLGVLNILSHASLIGGEVVNFLIPVIFSCRTIARAFW